MAFKNLCIGLSLLLAAECRFVESQQRPLSGGPDFHLIHELYQAEIIPTVLDHFKPFLTITAEWKKESAHVGNTIKPNQLQDMPTIQLRDHLPKISRWDDNAFPQLTLALTDPDAKSRDDPKWSQMLHWLITDVPLYHSGNNFASSNTNVTEIYPYKPPGPPPKTGKHRYVFVALAPKNGTTGHLFLTKPKERQHWGYGKVRAGVREWAEENGLEVVGANFFYAQDKKQ